MKYNIGDKVRVRTDLEVGCIYGNDSFVEEMKIYEGKIVTITDIDKNKYFIKEDNRYWYWTDEMLEPVENKPTITILVETLKKWDKWLGMDGENIKGIVRNDIQYLLKEYQKEIFEECCRRG